MEDSDERAMLYDFWCIISRANIKSQKILVKNIRTLAKVICRFSEQTLEAYEIWKMDENWK